MIQPIPSRRLRPAFTLLEILVVLAILVMLAGLSMPVWTRVLETQKLRKAGELVRAEFARTRVKAMKEGRIYMLRFQHGQAGYEQSPWYAADDDLESADSVALMADGGIVPPTASYLPSNDSGELPDGIFFLGSEALSDRRSLAIDQALVGAPSMMPTAGEPDEAAIAAWSQPVLFYPDGSSSNARVVIANRRNQVVEISLRGLTGMSQASDILRPEELVP